ncbi:MAG: hypothetical protein ACFFAO_07605 [Candidatus Hermodarchaeota archaeon]
MSYKNYTQSIKPSSIKSIQNFSDFESFMEHFNSDCEKFKKNISDISNFVNKFSIIKSELEQRNLFESLSSRIDYHSRLVNYKIESIRVNFKKIWSDYEKKINEIHNSIAPKLSSNILNSLMDENYDLLSEDDQKLIQKSRELISSYYIKFIGFLGGLVNLIFFAFEAQCKIFCALGCFHFSLKYANEIYTQHDMIWKTLKKLDTKESSQKHDTSFICEICQIRRECELSKNFETLANIYNYSIKIRMIADYREFFYKNNVSNFIKIFFDNLIEIITIQEYIKKKCIV